MTTPSTSSRKTLRTPLGRLLRSARSEHGQATVEIAFASVVLFCFVIGIMQVSRGIYVYNFVSEAAREAARYAMVRGSTSCANTPSLTNCNTSSSTNIQTYVQGRNYPGMVSSSLTATATYLCASASQPTTWSTCTTNPHNAPGNVVKVVVSYPFTLSVPFYSGASFTVSSTSQMVITQ
ncbi:MAG: pilus assembly protein [Silvibacterium sp.]|nr:pilus assembly protein [Silvibacterium sp.]